MARAISIIAITIAVIACVAAWWMHFHHKRAMQAALQQREAELTQEYLGLINRIMDRVSASGSKLDARTVEQALERLAAMMETSRRGDGTPLRPHVTAIGESNVATAATHSVPVHLATETPRGNSAAGTAGPNEDTEIVQAEVAQIIVTDREELNQRQFDSRFDIPPGRIAFVVDDGDGEIYTIDSDGANRTRLTRNDVHDLHPMWMPDGKQIAFMSEEDGKRELYVMNAHGKQVQHIPTEMTLDMPPAVSPDKQKVATVRMSGNQSSIHINSLDGVTEKVVIDDAKSPSWSPDGKQLAFERGLQIFIVNADGTTEKPLLPDVSRFGKSIQRMPRWSPNGDYLMYTGLHVFPNKGVEHVESGVFLLDLKTRERHQITSADEIGLEWSPDSSHIVFFRAARNDRGELFIVPAAGGSPFPLTRASADAPWASWRHGAE